MDKDFIFEKYKSVGDGRHFILIHLDTYYS